MPAFFIVLKIPSEQALIVAVLSVEVLVEQVVDNGNADRCHLDSLQTEKEEDNSLSQADHTLNKGNNVADYSDRKAAAENSANAVYNSHKVGDKSDKRINDRKSDHKCNNLCARSLEPQIFFHKKSISGKQNSDYVSAEKSAQIKKCTEKSHRNSKFCFLHDDNTPLFFNTAAQLCSVAYIIADDYHFINCFDKKRTAAAVLFCFLRCVIFVYLSVYKPISVLNSERIPHLIRIEEIGIITQI